ncbi:MULTISPECIES: hypothetical protein [unclassified Romboutsia]|uniref:hypothetical protein n=1 Tax=unclassified Romboutsia TaxID=2626894 RepID=UPI00082302AF|nr:MULTISPECIES: hypothetical protein [unclassified Romboutsia]SCH71161.1 Uncharacterised protein [uncultured Clostridium sp.]
MSLFLGKIHYWLFNKILWFEGLEDEIIKLAKNEGLDIESLTNEINLKYEEKLPNKNLEDMIDTGNIHGWLQSKIHSAEGRMAILTKSILKNNENSLAKIEKIYTFQGIKAAKEVKQSKNLTTATEIYTSINDYILDGMPCDRVNQIITSEDDKVEWIRRICVHKDIWDKENIDVDIFYKLRNLWIKAFVSEVNSNFNYIEKEDKTYVISKKN